MSYEKKKELELIEIIRGHVTMITAMPEFAFEGNKANNFLSMRQIAKYILKKNEH